MKASGQSEYDERIESRRSQSVDGPGAGEYLALEVMSSFGRALSRDDRRAAEIDGESSPQLNVFHGWV